MGQGGGALCCVAKEVGAYCSLLCSQAKRLSTNDLAAIKVIKLEPGKWFSEVVL